MKKIFLLISLLGIFMPLAIATDHIKWIISNNPSFTGHIENKPTNVIIGFSINNDPIAITPDKHHYTQVLLKYLPQKNLVSSYRSFKSNHSNSTLVIFLAVHKEYCTSDFPNLKALKNALSGDKNYKISDEFDGIYEKTISNVSYAVSPEESGCTTDLKLKVEGENKLHFSFNQLNDELIAEGYTLQGKKNILRERGLDDEMLTVVEQTYLSSNNEITTLMYPVEREDQYYMTFFTEKF